jgi:hypothetical protein
MESDGVHCIKMAESTVRLDKYLGQLRDCQFLNKDFVNTRGHSVTALSSYFVEHLPYLKLCKILHIEGRIIAR